MGGGFFKQFACCFQHHGEKEDEGIELARTLREAVVAKQCVDEEQTAIRAAPAPTSPPPLLGSPTITTSTADRDNSDNSTSTSHPTSQDATDTITPTSNPQSHPIGSSSKPVSDPDQITQLPTTTVGENGEFHASRTPYTHAENETEIRRRMYERLRVSDMERSQHEAYNQWANVKNAAEERRKMLERLRRPAPSSGA